MDDLLQEFLTETSESLSTLDIELIKLEQNPDDAEILSNIFRLMHTLKGTCGFLGLPRLEAIAHAGENVLGKIRDGELKATPEIVTLILEVIDRIRMILVALEEQQAEPEGDDHDLRERLEKAASGEAGASTPQPSMKSEAQEAAPPPPAEVQQKEAASLATKQEEAPEARDGNGARTGSIGSQSIRVNLSVLENLMTMVSELVLTRNQLLQLTRDQHHEQLNVPLQRLNQVVSELQEGVMKTRMQPIENAWTKLPRIVRDLGQELGKKIQLVMEGADTELDRQVLEMIRDPLTHMVRNSADHGLERPEERLAQGKPEVGTILLNAFHQGGHIIIQISDDGRGVDIERVRQKAIANGLATEEQLAGMTDQQICQFVFRPGFSTAKEVTAVSGRGVGMDVVRSNIEKIGGNVELTSTAGQGSCFTIKIPLTLAIVPALIVESSGMRFAIPQIAVQELVRLAGDDDRRIEHVEDTPVLRLRDSLLPLVHLRKLLRLPTQKEEMERFIVVARVGAYSFGILVDRILDTEEIVVKPVSALLKKIPVFSGNTILGDGAVVMILDPNGIAASSSEINLDNREEQGAEDQEMQRQESLAMLLFKASDNTPKAIPLALVRRLEEIESSRIEHSDGRPIVQYRGQLMPLLTVDPQQRLDGDEKLQVIVFANEGKPVGLVVDEILDIVETEVDINTATSGAHLIGTATVAGKATDILDVGWFLEKSFPKMTLAPGQANGQSPRRRDILLIDPDDFHEGLLRPHFLAAGIALHAAPSLKAGQQECQRRPIDAIVIDLSLLANGLEEKEAVAALASGEHPIIGLTDDPEATAQPGWISEVVRRGDIPRLMSKIAKIQ